MSYKVRELGRNDEKITDGLYLYTSILKGEHFIPFHDYINGAG